MCRFLLRIGWEIEEWGVYAVDVDSAMVCQYFASGRRGKKSKMDSFFHATWASVLWRGWRDLGILSGWCCGAWSALLIDAFRVRVAGDSIAVL
jgi:hypothetical protein